MGHTRSLDSGSRRSGKVMVGNAETGGRSTAGTAELVSNSLLCPMAPGAEYPKHTRHMAAGWRGWLTPAPADGVAHTICPYNTHVSPTIVKLHNRGLERSRSQSQSFYSGLDLQNLSVGSDNPWVSLTLLRSCLFATTFTLAKRIYHPLTDE